MQALGIDTEDDIHQLAGYFLKSGFIQQGPPAGEDPPTQEGAMPEDIQVGSKGRMEGSY